MSISTSGVAAPLPTDVNTSFETNLNIAKSSQIIADHMNSVGKFAISKQDLETMAEGVDVSPEVAAAASYMLKHESVFTAIETNDVVTVDDFSGVWNFEWAAAGGLDNTAIGAIAHMEDAFDRAIQKSAEITNKTTAAKTELDATKQRPQN